MTLMDYRRALCQALEGLVGEEWQMVVRLINRIDRQAKATFWIVIEGQIEDLIEAAEFFEVLAQQIRRDTHGLS